MTPSRRDHQDAERNYWRFAGVGVQFGLTIILLTLLGVWLDHKAKTSPLFTIALLFLGLAAATYNLMRDVLGPAGTKRPQRDHPRDDPEGKP